MSWNEPGGGKKDPWSGRGGDDKGPPDLDEAIRALQEKIGGIFGGGGGGGGSSPGASMKGFGFLIGGAVVLWGLSGFYIVDEGNHGVVTRFGKYTETTQAGLNWHIPVPIESVELVNVRRQRFIEVGYRSGGAQQTLGSVPKEALMLTKDENIVDVRLAVQYQVKDAKDFLFNVVSPEITLKQVTEAAQRGVVGSSKMDFVLTEGRTEIVAQIREEIQDVMDSYKSGVQITSVNLQDAQPPEQVQGAFEDAIKAREDQQRLINEAEAYSNDVIPKARGAAARKMQEAEGYKQQVIARAEGEASRFLALLGEYKKAPEVTRKRLYIESVQSVLTHSNTVFLDVKSGNNLMYLPLDKIIKQSPTDETAQKSQAGSVTQTRPIDPVFRTTTRGREGRGR
ncbi:FtsH protease activity modulator HflK [Methylotuvimicrobium buryatense]|uniref:Protein HflK n=1 Tax=Methylotuvimicrobium buryatense TaxID=95641 RepID=A0A4P9UUS7_METBY|nr:FtsH protease activity modulator HflK [Methylotuvimicrobium buryatense]QCW83436.1 FtsH protease activity modulator HflK [Methylotuvimicrobium buryatense]